ncbi:MAG TPA: hypothetical protein VE867_05045 [Candidatus Binatia bacterium]|nr:hypothetical protein [Candidatus Binatia bacterium]
MRKATIRKTHRNTGKPLRASAHEKIVTSHRGQCTALLKSLDGPDLLGRPFPNRDFREMAKSERDSTDYISRHRDGR